MYTEPWNGSSRPRLLDSLRHPEFTAYGWNEIPGRSPNSQGLDFYRDFVLPVPEMSGCPFQIPGLLDPRSRFCRTLWPHWIPRRRIPRDNIRPITGFGLSFGNSTLSLSRTTKFLKPCQTSDCRLWRTSSWISCLSPIGMSRQC